MFRLTEVVKHLLIINVLLYFGTEILMGSPEYIQTGMPLSEWGRYQLAMFYPTNEYFRPFQIVSHMFMHASLPHLFFNMFALVMFGPMLEALWGSKRFLFYYLFSGFGALALYLFVKFIEINYMGDVGQKLYPMLGASGAVFGILMGFGLKFPNQRIMLLFPPIPMRAIVFVSIYAGIELLMGLGPFRSGVAHFAHVGGALFGALLILYWNKTGRNHRRL